MYPIIKIGVLSFPTFQIILLIAVFICSFALLKSKLLNMNCFEELIEVAAVSLVFAAIGGKILFFVVMKMQGLKTGWECLTGGFVFYGGLIGGTVGIVLCSKHFSRRVKEYTDIMAMILPLGQALGRIGCFLNGCCYGCDYNGPLSVAYPVSGTVRCVFPVWFLEAVICLLIFIQLNYLCKSRKAGYRTAIYFIEYGITRFLLEFLRGDEIRGYLSVLSVSQAISIAVVIIGIITIIQTKNTEDNIFFEEVNEK